MDTWFSRGLADWYRLNKRDLPWRNERDPYKIWLSEIILQQTQVAQGLPYYLKFIGKYPTVIHLAKAKEDEVLKLWQGLGYYSRARNLHAAAKFIHNTLGGRFPSSLDEIRSLKGVGEYTAAAIASFAYDLPQAVVDGNVYRVLSRVFGIETAMDTGTGKKEFRALADGLLDRKHPANHNQAIMEFGARYCKPANPDCENCIFSNKCWAYAASQVRSLPVKQNKTKVRNRYFNYLVLVDKRQEILIHRRGEKDIWNGLYEFSLVESAAEIRETQLVKRAAFKSQCRTGFKVLFVSKMYKHLLSHQHLFSIFYIIRVNTLHPKSSTKSKTGQLKRFAFPRLIEKFLNDCDLKEII